MGAPIAAQDWTGTLARIMPECTDPEERDLRRRLALARDCAQAQVTVLPLGHSHNLNQMLVELSGQFLFAKVDVPELRLVVEQCRRLMRAAAGAFELEGRWG